MHGESFQHESLALDKNNHALRTMRSDKNVWIAPRAGAYDKGERPDCTKVSAGTNQMGEGKKRSHNPTYVVVKFDIHAKVIR